MYESILNRFIYYTNTFLFTREQREIINTLKLEHTKRVVDISETLAESVFGYGSERVDLAKVIALLHDIGRWEQFNLTGMFNDLDADHGETGADMIIKNNILSGMDEADQGIVLTAIRQHSKKLSDTHDELTQAYVNIVRDADKLDNYFVELKDYSDKDSPNKGALPFSNEHKLNERLYEGIMNNELANHIDRKTLIDFKFSKMAWVYDIKLAKSFEIIREKGYISAIFNAIKDPDERMTRAYGKICGFLGE
jgi:putative nucleotidyltransferase with HDIG domain